MSDRGFSSWSLEFDMGKRFGIFTRSVSTPIVFGLCAVAFLCGRYMSSFGKIPDLVPVRDEEDSRYQETELFGNERSRDGDEEGLLLAAKDDLPAPLIPGESGNDFYTNAPFQILSWYPRVLVFPNFINDERADYIVSIAKKKMHPSGVALRRGETAESVGNVRTSSGTFLTGYDDPQGVLTWLENKIAQVTMIPAEHGEAFNVLRYDLNQRYDAHYDVFDPESYGPQSSMRIATVLTYLSEVEEGGETVLPLEGVNGVYRVLEKDFSYKDCEHGLRYKPRKGDALLFYSIAPNGTFDRHSLHGGCPVTSGEKWVATKWIRDKCIGGGC
ncbi:hypothetical protein BSKO_08478 [Bryopsis sp. KO-2023]|nr:hypothetical protein BSKO_08478 [Bryopsis sp. KO-2023]